MVWFEMNPSQHAQLVLLAVLSSDQISHSHTFTISNNNMITMIGVHEEEGGGRHTRHRVHGRVVRA